MAIHVLMPALSPTMEAGTIVEWTVAPGGEVAAGSLLCEVETDKATVGFEFQDDAIIAKYLVEAGTEVAVGTPVAITVDDDDAFAAFKTADSAGQISIDNTAAAAIDSIVTPPPEPSLADSQMANAAPPPAPVQVPLPELARGVVTLRRHRGRAAGRRLHLRRAAARPRRGAAARRTHRQL